MIIRTKLYCGTPDCPEYMKVKIIDAVLDETTQFFETYSLRCVHCFRQPSWVGTYERINEDTGGPSGRMLSPGPKERVTVKGVVREVRSGKPSSP